VILEVSKQGSKIRGEGKAEWVSKTH